MIRFLAVQHTFAGFRGTLETRFEARGVAFKSLRPGTRQGLVAAATQFDGLWLFGAARPVVDPGHSPWVDVHAQSAGRRAGGGSEP